MSSPTLEELHEAARAQMTDNENEMFDAIERVAKERGVHEVVIILALAEAAAGAMAAIDAEQRGNNPFGPDLDDLFTI